VFCCAFTILNLNLQTSSQNGYSSNVCLVHGSSQVLDSTFCLWDKEWLWFGSAMCDLYLWGNNFSLAGNLSQFLVALFHKCLKEHFEMAMIRSSRFTRHKYLQNDLCNWYIISNLQIILCGSWQLRYVYVVRRYDYKFYVQDIAYFL